MNKYHFFFLSLIILSSCSMGVKKSLIDKKTVGLLPTEKQPELQEVAEFKGVQVTGITISKEGRLFANFPRWRNDVPFSVVEIMKDGTHKAYPNEKWNRWSGIPEKNTFTCIQSVYAHGDYLYVLDPSSPELKGVIGKAKLFRFDLNTNQLDKEWEFDENVAPKMSYLNDVRIDDKTGNIFISDSGLGGIVVLDSKTGQAKRVLDKHPSTKSENVTLTVDKTEYSNKTHADGIAISPVDNKLYYHALTGYQLYRVPAATMGETQRDETKLVKQIENLGVTPASDGMIFDKQGNLYMADLERNAVSFRTPGGDMKILVQDEKIKWPDSFTIDNENNLLFTDSLLHSAEVGEDVSDMTFKIYKVALPKTI